MLGNEVGVMHFLLCYAVGHLFGSIPCGLWIVQALHGIDIREYGSKNIGTTNVFRTVGGKTAALVWIKQFFDDYKKHCKTKRLLYRKSEKVAETLDVCIKAIEERELSLKDFDDFFPISDRIFEISELTLGSVCDSIRCCMEALTWEFIGNSPKAAVKLMDFMLLFVESAKDGYDPFGTNPFDDDGSSEN